MKLIATILLLLASTAYAEDSCRTETVVTDRRDVNTPAPSHLRGAKIIIRTADGKETEASAESFKVVPRKQQFVVTRERESTTCSKPQAKLKRNRISLIGGWGTQQGVDVDRSTPGVLAAQSKTGLVGGLQYQRLVTDTVSVGLQAQSNKTGSLMVGLDF